MNSPQADRMPDIAQQPEIDLLNLSTSNSHPRNAATKEPSFDLLGVFEAAEAQGNNTMPDLLSDSQTKPPGLDEIFSSFSRNAAASTNGHSSVMPDLSNVGIEFNAFGNANSNQRNQNGNNFDPFGNPSFSANIADVLLPTSRDASPQQPQAPPNVPSQAQNKDPFADIANLASGLNLNWRASQSNSGAIPKTTPVISPNVTQYPSPSHQFGGFTGNSASGSPQGPSTPNHQGRSPVNEQGPSQRPDYSRSHFEPKNPKAQAPQAGGAPGGDIFADILGQQGYSFASKPSHGPRTINAMRKEEMVREMDPDKLKILEWVRLIDSFPHFVLRINPFSRLKGRKAISGRCSAQCTPFCGTTQSGRNAKCIYSSRQRT